MRVAVVGATGNCGTAVLSELARRSEVTSVLGIARRMPDQASEPYQGADWLSIDIQAEDAQPALREAFSDIDAVIHLAWLLQPNSDRELLRRVNVGGTRKVLESAAQAGVERIAVASSVGAYSPVEDDEPRDESWPTGGIEGSHYSMDKAAQERVMDEVESAYPAVALSRMRPGLIFQRSAGSEIQRYFAGPWAPAHLLHRRWLPLVPLPGGTRIQALHTRDVAVAYVEAILRGARGAFNLCAPDLLDAGAISQAVGRGRSVSVPLKLVRPLVLTAHRLHAVPMDEGWLDLAVRAPLMDCRRAERELGWRVRISAVDALAELMEGLGEGAGHASPPLRPRAATLPQGTELPTQRHRIGQGVDALLLRQYMTDHLTGATAGMNRIRRMAEVFVDTPVFPQLSSVAQSIAEEHQYLQDLIKRQGFSRPAITAPLFWAGEKASRLKPYSRPPGMRSPSALVLETELMLSAVSGKLHGWKVMREHAEQLGVREAVFDQLCEDAETQRDILENIHHYARQRAFRPDMSTFAPED